MKKENITKAALSLRRKFGVVSGRELCELLEVDIVPLYPDGRPNAFNAFVVKQNRRHCIVLNEDLLPSNQELVLYHECGHIVLKHTDDGLIGCRQLFATRETSIKEIEANEFAVEYYLDDDEVIQTLKETNSFYATASILRVTPEMLAYKWRMLAYYGLISGECPILPSSDCMGHLDNDGRDDTDFGW